MNNFWFIVSLRYSFQEIEKNLSQNWLINFLSISFPYVQIDILDTKTFFNKCYLVYYKTGNEPIVFFLLPSLGFHRKSAEIKS